MSLNSDCKLGNNILLVILNVGKKCFVPQTKTLPYVKRQQATYRSVSKVVQRLKRNFLSLIYEQACKTTRTTFQINALLILNADLRWT